MNETTGTKTHYKTFVQYVSLFFILRNKKISIRSIWLICKKSDVKYRKYFTLSPVTSCNNAFLPLTSPSLYLHYYYFRHFTILTWFDFTWFYLTWLDLTLLDLTLLVLIWLYLSWFDFTCLDLTWLYFIWLYLPWFYLPWFDFTCLDLTLLALIWLYLPWFDFTCLDLTLPDLSCLDMTCLLLFSLPQALPQSNRKILITLPKNWLQCLCNTLRIWRLLRVERYVRFTW